MIIWSLSHAPREGTAKERRFEAVDADGKVVTGELPNLSDEPTLELSVVVPCYNETGRLPVMLDECVPVLNREFGSSWELLLVDDGSTDGTGAFALQWARDHGLRPGAMRICHLEKNRGKGGAVTHGMKHFRGRQAIFADADGASTFADVKKLCKAIGSRDDALAVGSRAHMVKTDAVVKRSFIRNFLMYGLHTLLYVFGIRTIADTQCGFKLFTRDAARMIFPYMHTEGWIFDVEILIIAFKKGIFVAEVPISWHEVAGSKIDLATDSVKMAVDLVVMRFAYWLGIYNERSLTMAYDRRRHVD